MKSVDDQKYLEVLRFLSRPDIVRTKLPTFSFSDETRSDLRRILGPKPELIARLQRQVAPAGIVPGPVLAEYRARRTPKAAQWKTLARALAVLTDALESLDYDAGIDLDTGGDGLWEFEHDREGPDIDLADFAEHAKRIAEVLDWQIRRQEPRGRGRPRGISDDRDLLGLGVALTLQQAGFPLTKSREGVLAKTLSILFDVAQLGAPEDMFDSVRSIVRRVDAVARRREGVAERAAAKEVVMTFLKGLNTRSKRLAGTTRRRKTRTRGA